MRKNLFFLSLLAISTQTFAQTTKAPNLFPTVEKASTKPAPAFLADFPTTNWSDYADTSWYNTSATSFDISTAEQLAGLSLLVKNGNDFSGKTINITANINLEAHLLDPIGYGYQTPFSGIVNGNNKTISNIFINRADGDFLGLFGQFFKASLKDLFIVNSKVYGDDTVGGVIGNISTNSTVENVHATGVEVAITGYNGGGFVGGMLTDSKVHNCSVKGNVDGDSQIGGFVGSPWDKNLITNSYCEGNVSGNYIIGGFSGFSTMAFGPNRNNVIENSYSRANVQGLNQYTGGFYGYAQQNAVVKNVYSTGTVYVAPQTTGGFAGAVGGFSAVNSFYDKTIAPIDAVGAFEYGPIPVEITGKTTEEMKTSTFKDQLDLGNAISVWAIDPQINNGYPYIGTQPLATQELKTLSKSNIVPSIVDQSFQIINPERDINYSILDVSGRVLKSGTVSGSQKTVNVNGLLKGNYILLLKTTKSSETLKFIKK